MDQPGKNNPLVYKKTHLSKPRLLKFQINKQLVEEQIFIFRSGYNQLWNSLNVPSLLVLCSNIANITLSNYKFSIKEYFLEKKMLNFKPLVPTSMRQ